MGADLAKGQFVYDSFLLGLGGNGVCGACGGYVAASGPVIKCW